MEFLFHPKGTREKSLFLLAKFGKPSEVAAAHTQCIISLPVTSKSNPNKIYEFDEMNKLRDIKEYLRLTLDKVPGISAELVRLDDDWQEWDFPKLAESLRKRTDQNPKTIF